MTNVPEEFAFSDHRPMILEYIGNLALLSPPSEQDGFCGKLPGEKLFAWEPSSTAAERAFADDMCGLVGTTTLQTLTTETFLIAESQKKQKRNGKQLMISIWKPTADK